MSHVLAHLVLALAGAQLVHGLMEVWSARMKVARLSAYIDRRPWTEMRVNVDSELKAFAFAATVFVVLTGVWFAIFYAIDPTGNALLIVAGALIFANYWSEIIGFDRYHVEIGRVTTPFQERAGEPAAKLST